MRFWFRGFHHLYLGIILMLIGFILMAIDALLPVFGMGIMIFGVVLVIDDAMQHYVQSTSNARYHSPIHRLYGFIYSRFKWVRKLNKWADKLFGVRDGRSKK